MFNKDRFHELCRRVEEEQDPFRLHETGRQMIELLRDEELELLERERQEQYKTSHDAA